VIISMLLVLTLLIILAYSLVLLNQNNFLGLIFSLLCLAAIFLVFFPEKATAVANIFGVGRGADLLLYFCFVAGSIVILLIHLRIRQQNYLITKIVRKMAISGASKNCRNGQQVSDELS